MWLIDEIYRRYRDDPGSVGEDWREFFEGFTPVSEPPTPPAADATGDGQTTGDSVEVRGDAGGARGAGTQAATTDASRAAAGAPSVSEVSPQPPRAAGGGRGLPEGAERLRFAAERIAKNMKASLEIPTATSFRFVPAKLLEENRRVINRFLAAGRGGKVSFTHLIGFAIVNALEAVPAMKRSYVEAEGRPYAVPADTVILGLAVAVART